MELRTVNIVEKKLTDDEPPESDCELPISLAKTRRDIIEIDNRIFKATVYIYREALSGQALWELLKQVKMAEKAIKEYNIQVNIFCKSISGYHWTVAPLASASQINCDKNLEQLDRIEKIIKIYLYEESTNELSVRRTNKVYEKRVISELRRCVSKLRLINSELEKVISYFYQHI